MTTGEAAKHPDWREAWAQAARELHMPRRGKRRSPENKERERLAPLVSARAKQMLERGELIRHD